MVSGGQSLGTAVLDLRINDRDFNRGLAGAERKVGGFGSTLKNVGQIAAGVFTANVVGSGLRSLTGFVNEGITAAANLEQSIGGVQSVFKDSADDILAWGEGAAQAAGLSKNSFNEIATATGAFLQNYGMDTDAAAKQTVELTQRAADMAATFGGSVADAMGAIQAGLRGQADPLERYGVSLTAARVEAHALAMTGKTATAMLSDQEKMAARIDLVFSQTSSTMGQFAREEGTAAGQAERLAAEHENVAAQLGEKLLPVQIAVTRAKLAFVRALSDHVIPALSRVAEWVGKVVDVFKALLSGESWRTFEPLAALGLDAKQILTVSDVLMGVRDTLAGLAKTIRDDVLPRVKELWSGIDDNLLPPLMKFGRWLLDNRPVLIGIGLAIGAIVAPGLLLAGAVAALIIKWDDLTKRFPILQRGLDAVRSGVRTMRDQFARFVRWAEGDLLPAWQNIAKAVTFAIETIVGFVAERWPHIQRIVEPIMRQILATIEFVMGVIREVISIAVDIISGDWEGAWNNIKDLFSLTWRFIEKTIDNALDYVKGILSAAWASIADVAGNAWDGIKGGLSSAWESIKSLFTRGKDAVVDIWDDLRSGILDTLDELRDGLMRPFRYLRENIGTVMVAAVNLILTPLNAAIRGFNALVDGIRRAINWVGRQLGMGELIGAFTLIREIGMASQSRGPGNAIPRFARGTDYFSGGLALVGEEGPELVRLPRGSGVTPAARTAAIMQAIREGRAIGGPLDWAKDKAKSVYNAGAGVVGNVTGAVWDFVKHWVGRGATALFNAALRAVGFEMPDLGGKLGDIMSGAWGKIKDGAIDYVKGLLTGAEESLMGDLIRPLTNYVISQRYGRTAFSGAYASGLHSGIDLAAPTGTPVGAAGFGNVTAAGWNGGYGNAIDIAHGDLMTRYGHLSRILVRLGETVAQGQRIGDVGSTGFSTGPHLHFEVRRNGVTLDPASLIGFDKGGIVPGPRGAPRLAMVHAGETVLPTHRTGGAGMIHIPVHIGQRRLVDLYVDMATGAVREGVAPAGILNR